eukprot:CAMPEP_0196136852 /NCGR_PEP_ID=MMETSP0910-20130528/5022_1 /TAXON_ID=49265 /ORGANISM="Thalassiosira rotula, Strain GSO102" /LENGTH=68 /DNA_ID=CAMNT_0041397209 /DNA_START=176 /DNA_END=379 /DNA_ORIENTATION=+
MSPTEAVTQFTLVCFSAEAQVHMSMRRRRGWMSMGEVEEPSMVWVAVIGSIMVTVDRPLTGGDGQGGA